MVTKATEVSSAAGSSAACTASRASASTAGGNDSGRVRSSRICVSVLASRSVGLRKRGTITRSRVSTGSTNGCLELLNGRDLDQQALAARDVELHLGDALGALARDGGDAALAEVVVTDAVADR